MNIAFVSPLRQVDAIHEPPRGGIQIGPALMASLLLEKGHNVHYLDESVRNGGWQRRTLSVRKLYPGVRGIQESAISCTWDELQAEKMYDFHNLSSTDFLKKWSAFREDGSVQRIIARIGIPEEETIQHLADLGVEAVGIPLAASANYLAATSLGRRIKRELGIRVVMGGQHITANPVQFVRDNPWVDHVAQGDAITTIEDMMAGRLKEKIVPGGFQTMDKYPVMNCDLLAEAGYSTPPTHNYPSGLKSIDWMASRGCYQKCAFCFAGRPEQKVTQSGWDKIRQQLDHFVACGYQELVLQDDAILYQAEKFFLPLLGEMKKRGLSWSDNGGVEFESFSDKVAEAIVAYNSDGRPGKCISLYVPFNPRQWNATTNSADSMTKRYENSLANLARVRQAGVYVLTSLIVGTPDQTRQMFDEDVAAARKLIVDGYLDSALPLSATMLPGTKWFERNGHNIVHQDDWAGYNLFSTHHSTDKIKEPRQIEKCMVDCVDELGDVQTIEAWQCAFA